MLGFLSLIWTFALFAWLIGDTNLILLRYFLYLLLVYLILQLVFIWPLFHGIPSFKQRLSWVLSTPLAIALMVHKTNMSFAFPAAETTKTGRVCIWIWGANFAPLSLLYRCCRCMTTIGYFQYSYRVFFLFIFIQSAFISTFHLLSLKKV